MSADRLIKHAERLNEGGRFHAKERGLLREGHAADLALVDPGQPDPVTRGEVPPTAGGTPFEGETCGNSIVSTFVNGRHMGWLNHRRQRARSTTGLRSMRSLRWIALWSAVFLWAPAFAATVASALPATLSQGGLVIVRLHPGSLLTVSGKPVHVGSDGIAVFGAGRDEKGPLLVSMAEPHGRPKTARISIAPRDWPIERINGVPPATVNPPPELAARIEREQAEVTAARNRDDAREDFLGGFIWPVRGRISGRFGNQRIYNGDPKAPHSGMDIAVPQGTPVRAPASGIVTFAQPDLYLTGGTILLDHGFGLSSNFLHLSKLEVNVGERVRQGQIIALSGMTGRATGPHLHWGFNWFGTRLDPLLLPGIAAP